MYNLGKNEEFNKLKRTDFKCSLCGVILSDTKDIPESDISDILNTNDEIAGFYNIYTFKCPIKNIHIFENDTCTQCGLTKLQSFKKDIDYFNKYKERFYSEITTHPVKNITKVFKPDDKINEWVVDKNPIIELSKMLKININILSNVGLIEGKNYDKIKSGEYKINIQDIDRSTQITNLESYITLFLIEYEMLKNGRLIRPSLELFAKKWPNIDFSKFPVLGGDYHEIRRKYNIDSASMANLLMCFLYNTLLKLCVSFPNTEPMHAAAVDFVQYIINSILSVEKAFSDPGIMRGKALEIEEEDELDTEYVEDVPEDFDPFSLESADIDESELNDNMGTGDD
jgi:hypothetical protein